MRCPWYLFHRLFEFGQGHRGPHDPLLPGGLMSCQSAPAPNPLVLNCIVAIIRIR
ncbi:unnamed protein product [Staurois parvus]|uniref:Uncharacterized protein n=1 Tax=Staurois parvus TaxID=386267 RepID=A0ABN9H301_9NEOB|nr:unnamed protein product [Staurois parvus]